MKTPAGKPMFCAKVDADLYRAIHIRAAEKGQTLQGYICGLLEQELHPRRDLTSDQVEEVHRLASELRSLSGELMEYLDAITMAQEEDRVESEEQSTIQQTEGMKLG